MNSRDLMNGDHSNGKGSRTRISDTRKYAAGMAEVKDLKPKDFSGFIRKGAKHVKIYTTAFLMFVTVAASAASRLTLRWDPSPTPGVSYRIYATNLTTRAVRVENARTHLTFQFRDLTPGPWRFTATAYINAGGTVLESDHSNATEYTVPKPTSQSPKQQREAELSKI